MMRTYIGLLALIVSASALAAQQPNPRQQPGATVTMYAPDQHDLYDGHFVISANRVYMVGSLNDPPGWNHMDNEAKTVKPVGGSGPACCGVALTSEEFPLWPAELTAVTT